MPELVLAVDQGTTGSTVLVVQPDGRVLGRGARDHPQSFPRPGWVEHDAVAIWASVCDAARAALADADVDPGAVAAVGITNQRETIVAWHRRSGQPLGPTVCWQDRRTASQCEALRTSGMEGRIRALTGLPLDPYFSATKIRWLLAHSDEVRAAATSRDLRLGTVDSWLAMRMCGDDVHVTDGSNASRTMLFDIHEGRWSDELCALFEVEPSQLPTVVDSAGIIARTDPTRFVGIDAPVAGIAGDQQAALFGQACLERGQAKATYGTGAFVLVNNGDAAPASTSLISTVAWRLGDQSAFALEGAMFTAGASVQWLRDGIGIIDRAAAVEDLAAEAVDAGGVVVVPAFAGLGAPHWDPYARGAVLGVTRGTTRAHIARATLDAVAMRVREIVDAMAAEGTAVRELRVDGGMATNRLFLQAQADMLGIPVTRPANVETTSLGAAFLAALGVGLHASPAAVAAAWRADEVFEPRAGARGQADASYARFVAAVSAVRQFAATGGTSSSGAGAADSAAPDSAS